MAIDAHIQRNPDGSLMYPGGYLNPWNYDLGISERTYSAMGASPEFQANQANPATANTLPKSTSTPNSSQLNYTPVGDTLTKAVTSNPNPSGGSGGGGDTELQQLQKMDRNPAQETRYQELLKSMENSQKGSAEAQAEAARQAALARYKAQQNIAGKAKESAKGQYDWLIDQVGSNKEDLLSKVALSEKQGLEDYAYQEKKTKEGYDKAKQDILSTYRDLAREQEKLLRGAGMGRSSRSLEAQMKLNGLLGKDLSTVSTNEADSIALIGNAVSRLKENSKSSKDSIEKEASSKLDQAAFEYSDRINNIDANLYLSEAEKETALAEAEAGLKSAVASIDSWVSQQEFEFEKYLLNASQVLDDYVGAMTDENQLLNSNIDSKREATNQFLSTIGYNAISANPETKDPTVGVYQKATTKDELDKMLQSGQITRAQYDAQVQRLSTPAQNTGSIATAQTFGGVSTPRAIQPTLPKDNLLASMMA